jgi:prepilin peptidase CpaA
VIASALLFVFPVAMAFAAANDLFTMKIPNAISIALIAAFCASVFAVGLTWQDAATHIGVGAAVLVFGFALFSFNLLGGGDAKLMAAGALWMGFDQVAPYIIYVTLFGGFLSLAILFYRHFIPATNWPLPEWAHKLHANGTGIPYGIAIAAAALKIYPATVWFKVLSV